MAEFDQELRIADVYAAALLELAREAQRVDDVRSELDELLKLVQRMPDFETFLSSRALGAEARAVALEKLLRGRISDLVLNTLLVMNRHGRCGLLPALQRRFVLRQEAAAGEIEAQVTSAVELSKSQKAEVAEIAAGVSGKKPLIEFAVDPALLGGLVLRIGDLRMDNSLRRHLRVAREQLLERGARGLEIAVEGD